MKASRPWRGARGLVRRLAREADRAGGGRSPAATQPHTAMPTPPRMPVSAPPVQKREQLLLSGLSGCCKSFTIPFAAYCYLIHIEDDLCCLLRVV